MAMTTAKTPRGVRNNNPGNIDRTNVVWQGEDRSMQALAKETRFCVFKTPQFGFRALAKTLQTYQRKHELGSVRAIINRWAPPSENNTSAYVRQVASALGVGIDETISVNDHATAFKLVKAIAHHENGGDFWPDAIIHEGLEQAGIHA